MRLRATGWVLLAALLALTAAPVAVADDDCVAVERDGVMVYPEGCTQQDGMQGQGEPKPEPES